MNDIVYTGENINHKEIVYKYVYNLEVIELLVKYSVKHTNDSIEIIVIIPMLEKSYSKVTTEINPDDIVNDKIKLIIVNTIEVMIIEQIETLSLSENYDDWIIDTANYIGINPNKCGDIPLSYFRERFNILLSWEGARYDEVHLNVTVTDDNYQNKLSSEDIVFDKSAKHLRSHLDYYCKFIIFKTLVKYWGNFFETKEVLEMYLYLQQLDDDKYLVNKYKGNDLFFDFFNNPLVINKLRYINNSQVTKILATYARIRDDGFCLVYPHKDEFIRIYNRDSMEVFDIDVNQYQKIDVYADQNSKENEYLFSEKLVDNSSPVLIVDEFIENIFSMYGIIQAATIDRVYQKDQDFNISIRINYSVTNTDNIEIEITRNDINDVVNLIIIKDNIYDFVDFKKYIKDFIVYIIS